MTLRALPRSPEHPDVHANTTADFTAAEAPLTRLSGWGRYPVVEGREALSENLERITCGAALTRGLGRSYGDASLPAPGHERVAGSVLADRLLAFDPDTGIVRAEAGCPLWRLNRIFLPRGFFTPVTPGTHYVTLGGMVAADVHGKSHHVDGCFGEHVTRLKMRVADGRILECSDDEERDLFRATLGGMGLTGHILEVEFRLRRIPTPWIWQESERTADFDATLERLRAGSQQWPMTVGWADFLITGPRAGRGLVMVGRWAEPGEAPAAPPRFRHAPSIPAVFPSWFLQPWMVRVFNRLIYLKHGARVRRGIVHPETFFYPLDVVRNWNRLYGPRGFTQYQCVLPTTGDNGRHHRFLARLQELKAPVFLCVPKDCGPEGKGILSFPKPGVSYALDLPVTTQTQALVDALNEFVVAEGGRVYLAKDAFTRAEHFRAMEPRLDAWTRVRRHWDPHGTLRSAQSVRILGDTP
ncbi:MAG TPA: FAD-binding oxidoreductase [Candidatus Margulisiibacteriota bacterium]|nr:FAD-binding oxidoreductase [Candidatus Margulisiibacteriota bacterium]